jgi:hypothetical protein
VYRYLITYDLVGTSETSLDYERLIEAIKSYPDYFKVQKSVWVVKSTAAAKEIYEHLSPYTDSDDRLIVFRLDTGQWWGRRAIDGVDALKTFIG